MGQTKNTNIYDLIIVGAGPAGLIASIYASRYKLNNLVIGKVLGGELSLASKVENYPGIISLSGLELNQKIAQQVEMLGGKILYKEVGRIEKKDGGFLVVINDQERYEAKALIVATGSERRRLNVPGEKELTGRGVSYCTTCDAPFYKGKTVALVGGSDAAVTGAIHAAEFASQIYIIYRGEQLRAEPMWLDQVKQLMNAGKVKVIYKTNITQIFPKVGNGVVGSVKLDNPYNGKDTLPVDGVFIEIGGVPGTTLVQPLGIELDETGHVKVSEKMETNIAGLFCAGDMVDRANATMKQAITAMAFGAIAAASAFKYLKGQQAPQIRGV
jgi:thioredoxin reductase (NADPH)